MQRGRASSATMAGKRGLAVRRRLVIDAGGEPLDDGGNGLRPIVCLTLQALVALDRHHRCEIATEIEIFGSLPPCGNVSARIPVPTNGLLASPQTVWSTLSVTGTDWFGFTVPDDGDAEAQITPWESAFADVKVQVTGTFPLLTSVMATSPGKGPSGVDVQLSAWLYCACRSAWGAGPVIVSVSEILGCEPPCGKLRFRLACAWVACVGDGQMVGETLNDAD